MAEGRVKKSLINSVIGLVSYAAIIILMFYSQRIFVNFLGYGLIGLNSVFNTIITTLSVAELGIGIAIGFSLYQPLEDKDERKIAAIIALFRRLYLIIGLIILVIGLGLIPLLPLFTKFEYSLSFLILPYLIFLVNIIVSYLFTFNHTLVIADQKNFISAITAALSKILIIVFQIVSLYLWQNYLIFLLVMFVFNSLSNIGLSLFVANQYPYLKKYKNEKLESDDSKKLKSTVTALLFHRIGNYLVTGTDNLIISGFLGVVIVGYYTSYLTIITAITALTSAMFAGIIASLGNLIITSEKHYVKKIFNRFRFLNFVIFVIAATGIFVLSDQFMSLWLSKETILPLDVLIFICLNFYIVGYSSPLGNIRLAAGVFAPDKYLHIVIAVLNLVISIVLVNFIGLTGVLLGTTICLLIKECIVLPIIGSKYIYGGKPKEYYIRFVLEFLLFAAISALCLFLNQYIATGSARLDFILGGGVCVAVPLLILFVIYFKTDEFRYFVGLLKKILKIKPKTNITGGSDENNTDGA